MFKLLRMKNLLYLLSISILLLPFNACKSDKDDPWQEANSAAYEAITKNPSYEPLLSPAGPTGVYYHVIQTGTGTEHPLQTSSVKVLYQGSYYDGTIFDYGSTQSGVPQELVVNGTLIMNGVKYSGTTIARGLSFALQNMVVGDKWEIWIPYYLAYGVGDYYDTSTTYQLLFKAYSTLVYEVELVSITQYP
jgi:FKBP-type peptidyl-prolyl cis-trans isomerase